MLCPVCVCLVALSFCSIQFSVAVLNLIHLNKINWIHQQQQHHHQKQKMASAIDTNSMTMTRYVIMEQRNVRDATGELTTLLNALQTGKRIFGMPKKKKLNRCSMEFIVVLDDALLVHYNFQWTVVQIAHESCVQHQHHHHHGQQFAYERMPTNLNFYS